jgi:hypothetical protein
MTDHVSTPDSERPGPDEFHSRITDKRRFTGEPEMEDVPEEEDVEGTDLDDRLDEDPESATNLRDVPPTPENSREARTEDD